MDDDFDEYVGARTRALMRLAYVLTGDAHLAEDVVQEVLARAHGRWDRVSQAESPHAYVRRMVVNEVRSRHRRRRVLLVFRPPERVPEHPILDAGDESSALETMWGLVSSLPPRQRTVLVLRYYEDLPDDQIAVAMSISQVTVRSTASRALAALRASPELTGHLIPGKPPAAAQQPAHPPAPCTQESL